MKLSILIPYTFDRLNMLDALVSDLRKQIGDCNARADIEILTDNRPQEVSIGTKRNTLLSIAIGEYIAFIDSDDKISPNYIETLLNGIETGTDCIGLKGEITINGGKPEIFEHSIKYNEWKTNEGALSPAVKYERNPNHLNCVKSSIAKQMTFPETSHGEDHEYSKQLFASGLIKTEYPVNHVIYYYKYLSKK